MSAPRRAGFLGDSRGLSVTAILLAIVVAGALFIVSYQGLAYAAEAIGLHDAPWVVPLAIDGGILVAGLLAAVKRGQKSRATLELTILWAATLASSGANLFAHAERGDGTLAIVVATAAPVFFLAITESIIRTIIQDEVAEKKPRRAAKRAAGAAVATAPAEVVAATAPTAPARTPRPAAPRAPRPSAGSIPNSYPFDEVMGMSEDVLLMEFDALAADPNSSVRGSAESPRFSAVAWRLVEAHGHRLSDLARRAGHADSAKIKDRVRNVRAKAPATV